MIRAGLLQRLEFFGGNTRCAQLTNGGSRRPGETGKLSNWREVWQLVSGRCFVSGAHGQCLRTDCRAGGDARRR